MNDEKKYDQLYIPFWHDTYSGVNPLLSDKFKSAL